MIQYEYNILYYYGIGILNEVTAGIVMHLPTKPKRIEL